VVGDSIKIPIVVKQSALVLNGDRTDQAINRRTNRDTVLTKRSVELSRTGKGCARHRQVDQPGKIVRCFTILRVLADALKHLREDDPHRQISSSRSINS
jgi:hypothetical protein